MSLMAPGRVSNRVVMDVYSSLSHTLKQRPFDEKPSKQRFKLNCKQCRTLASHFCVVLDKFFETAVLTQPSVSSSLSSPTSRPWNSAFFSKTLSKWWSMRRVNKSSSAVSNDDSGSPILRELRTAPEGLEELYRVIKEAQNFLITCSNLDWCRAAVTFGLTAEARDVHIHDLVWCFAGLRLALHSLRGVDWESRAQFCRLSMAQCYAELDALSAGTADLVRNEEQDREDLMKKLKKVNDGRNSILTKMASTNKKHKQRTADFLLHKLTPLNNVETAGAAIAFRKPAQSMQIRSSDLTFPSPPRLIDNGNYGSVYEAFWLGIKVAVKQFAYDTGKVLFESEAAILTELQCPFIVQLIGWCVDVENNTCSLVFELVKTNLQKFVETRRKPLRLPVVIDSMLQISRGMEYLHYKRIIHRDLKPGNILVEPLSSCLKLKKRGYGRMKICDFGSARWKLDGCSSMSSRVGTLKYRAPEVWDLSSGFGTECIVETALDKAKYSYEADVYSFSITFAFTLTGKEPFEGTNSPTELLNMLRKGVRPELPANCPRFLKEFLHKCWSQNPSSRPSFPSISMMLRHFKLLLMKERTPNRDHKLVLSIPAVAYNDIVEATGGFTRRAQHISVNDVFHGVLFDDTPVLVHFNQDQLVDHGSVWLDVSQMLSLRHGNVVQLHAVCIHHTQCWFLYEHACVQTSLDVWLENPAQPLDEDACFRVAVGVANGLQYLHSRNMLFPVTTKNILLNEGFEPQILVNSLVCEKKDGVLADQKRVDVLHFREVIGKLLLHLSSNLSQSKNTSQYPLLASSLNEVERFCLEKRDASMDEVVEMLERHIIDAPVCLNDNLCAGETSANSTLEYTLLEDNFCVGETSAKSTPVVCGIPKKQKYRSSARFLKFQNSVKCFQQMILP